MVYELVRTIIQKILQDKILLGLLIICVLGLFVGGMTMGDSHSESAKAQKESEQTDQKPATPPADTTPKLDVTLATQFINWWLPKAMDYDGRTTVQSHTEAIKWMTPEAATTFQSSFWTPQMADAIAAGRMVAGFQATGIQAQAINPDGGIVIGVVGTMVVQNGGQPVTQQFTGSFLVKQEKDGLRVAGVDAHSTPVGSSTIY